MSLRHLAEKQQCLHLETKIKKIPIQWGFFVPFPGPAAADLACACDEELYPLLYSTPAGPAVSSSYPEKENISLRDRALTTPSPRNFLHKTNQTLNT